jgi:hypothetical protein
VQSEQSVGRELVRVIESELLQRIVVRGLQSQCPHVSRLVQ